MRARAGGAALAGLAAAATAHALDEGGQLPFVHEAAHVRDAMSPQQLVCWLALAALVAAVAAVTRPVLVGGPGVLVVAALPELVGRLDPGAVVEPGALTGAALQWLLLAVVLGLAVTIQNVVRLAVVPTAVAAPIASAACRALPVPRGCEPGRTGRPRAPPRHADVLH